VRGGPHGRDLHRQERGEGVAELSKQGAELIATGIYTRDVVHNIEKRKSNRQR